MHRRSSTDPNNPLLYSQIQKLQLLMALPQFFGFAGDEPPIANSIYHALQLRAEKRFSNGLEFLATYTFSKSIDDASLTSTNSGYLGSFASLQNPNNPGGRAQSLFVRYSPRPTVQLHLRASDRAREAHRKQYEPDPQRVRRWMADQRHLAFQQRPADQPDALSIAIACRLMDRSAPT